MLFDPFIYNYYEYENGIAEPIIKGRLKSALPYWRDVIKAPLSVLSIIEKGFMLDFIIKPPCMHFNNNKSAIVNAEFVNKAVDDLLQKGLIKKVIDKPTVISPLSVASNSEKKRLILDLSILNEYIHYDKVKLENEKDFYEMSKFMNFVVTFDIKSCYHQIDMNEDFTTYLGFEWIIDGKKSYFEFLCVPFGLSPGPRVCKKLFRPLITRWRLNGLCTVLFYDDGIIGGIDYEICEKSSDFVFNDFLLCHILPNCKKSCWKPQKVADWLGYTWDFNR
jgi:hypothetical protein